MCLYVDRVEHPILEPKVALNDINVWKIILKCNNESIHQGKMYKPNSNYGPVKLGQSYHAAHIVYEGFHAYRTRQFARSTANTTGSNKLVKFTIPKGAKYFIGLRGDIVATRIRSGDLEQRR